MYHGGSVLSRLTRTVLVKNCIGLVFLGLMFSLSIFTACASSISVINSQFGTRLVGLPDASFDTLILANAVSGISYNEFSSFNVSTKKLVIYNGISSDTASPLIQTIIIKAPNISLTNEIEIIGSPANVLLVSSGTVTCSNCSFSNFGRVTLASSLLSSRDIISSTAVIGSLEAVQNGQVVVNNISSPGIQSLELFAHDVKTSGILDINLRADLHPEGGLVMHSQGTKIVGSGGINVYSGKLSLNYEDLKVTNAIMEDRTLSLDGTFKAASIAVVSPNNIEISSSTSLNTITDALSTSTINGQFYSPIEGVFIQIVGKDTADKKFGQILIKGRVSTDGILMLKGLADIVLNNSVLAKNTSIIARDIVTNLGFIQSQKTDIAAKVFINEGDINSSVVNVETEGNIYNSFGGDIKSNIVILKSNNGNVVNGSRSIVKSYSLSSSTLPINTDITMLKHGIFYDLNENGNPETITSANIIGNDISIQANAFENINPYFITKTSADNWDSGIAVNNTLARQVSLQAENRLEIKAKNYLLNSSAVLGLNQDGMFIVNTPLLSNERYRLEVENFVYNQVLYSPDKSREHDQASVGLETRISTYSPPGRMYSYGEFRFSDGSSTDAISEQFINEFSYFESFGNAHFHQTQIKSVGMELSQTLSYSLVTNVRSCLIYGNCQGDKTVTRADAETLFSVGGNLYGVDPSLPSQSDLVVTNINAYSALVQTLVRNYLSQFYFEKSETEYGYVSKSEIDGQILHATVVACNGNKRYEIPAGPGYTLIPNCVNNNINKSIDQLIADDSAGREHPGTGYTPAQINSASTEFVKTIPYVDQSGYNIVFRLSWSKQYNSYTFDPKTNEVIVAYTQYAKFVLPQVGERVISTDYTRKLALSELMTFLPK